MDDGPVFGVTEAIAAIAAMPLDQLEEASGELHRRVAGTLRDIGELNADAAERHDRSPRQHVAALAAEIELAAATFGAILSGGSAPSIRVDRHPATVAAVMYAAPTLPALLQRLEQDRRLLTSMTRHLEPRLDETHDTPWGQARLRDVLVEVAIAEPARCSQLLERHALALQEAELRRLQEEAARE